MRFAQSVQTPPYSRQTKTLLTASLQQFSLRFFSKAERGSDTKIEP